MTIEEILEAKKKAQSDILKILEQFTEQTGLNVSDIHGESIDVGGLDQCHHSILSAVELVVKL